MKYVYILQSLKDMKQTYVGLTNNIQKRIDEHNSGKSIYTNKYKPWKLKTYIAFESEAKAFEFERYLKHGSGHAFLKRHF